MEPLFWIMATSASAMGAYFAAQDMPGQTAETVNLLAINEFRSASGQEKRRVDTGHIRIEDMPMPILTITAPGFSPHAFATQGMVLYFSAHLREVADLSDREVQYIEIDDSGSTREVQEMDYRMVHFPAVRGEAVVPESVDLHSHKDWETGEIEYGSYKDFEFRPGYEPDVDVFLLPYWNYPFVTDAFATRILAAGITDLEFRHPTYGLQAERHSEEVQMQTKTLE